MQEERGHDCRFEDKIIDMYGWVREAKTDIKWLRANAERRNGIIDNHIEESDDFRNQVTRNTAWRQAFKFILSGLGAIRLWIIAAHLIP